MPDRWLPFRLPWPFRRRRAEEESENEDTAPEIAVPSDGVETGAGEEVLPAQASMRTAVQDEPPVPILADQPWDTSLAEEMLARALPMAAPPVLGANAGLGEMTEIARLALVTGIPESSRLKDAPQDFQPVSEGLEFIASLPNLEPALSGEVRREDLPVPEGLTDVLAPLEQQFDWQTGRRSPAASSTTQASSIRPKSPAPLQALPSSTRPAGTHPAPETPRAATRRELETPSRAPQLPTLRPPSAPSRESARTVSVQREIEGSPGKPSPSIHSEGEAGNSEPALPGIPHKQSPAFEREPQPGAAGEKAAPEGETERVRPAAIPPDSKAPGQESLPTEEKTFQETQVQETLAAGETPFQREEGEAFQSKPSPAEQLEGPAIGAPAGPEVSDEIIRPGRDFPELPLVSPAEGSQEPQLEAGPEMGIPPRLAEPGVIPEQTPVLIQRWTEAPLTGLGMDFIDRSQGEEEYLPSQRTPEEDELSIDLESFPPGPRASREAENRGEAPAADRAGIPPSAPVQRRAAGEASPPARNLDLRPAARPRERQGIPPKTPARRGMLTIQLWRSGRAIPSGMVESEEPEMEAPFRSMASESAPTRGMTLAEPAGFNQPPAEIHRMSRQAGEPGKPVAVQRFDLSSLAGAAQRAIPEMPLANLGERAQSMVQEGAQSLAGEAMGQISSVAPAASKAVQNLGQGMPNIQRLTDEIWREIQRRLRVERERTRGLS